LRRWTDVAISCTSLLNLEKHFDLTSARFTLQSSKYAFLKQSSVPTSSARPNLVLVRLPSSSSLPFNKSSQLLARLPSWSCATLVSLAYQIKNEYARFSKYMPDVKTAVFYGGTPIQKDAEILKNKETHPHIIVATPGRLNALVRDKYLRLGSCKVFVLDECDKMLDQIGKNFVSSYSSCIC
jgi:hypothetical protein